MSATSGSIVLIIILNEGTCVDISLSWVINALTNGVAAI